MEVFMNKLATRSGGSLFRPMFRDLFDLDTFFNKGFEDGWDVAVPKVNVQENDKAFMMEVVVPGFNKDDLKIKVEKDMLTISAEVKSEEEKKEKEYTRCEYRFQSFSRSFHLPENVKEDAIEANYSDGVLKLTLPKADAPVTVSKQIAVQ
jgi:HSP20 family protein